MMPFGIRWPSPPLNDTFKRMNNGLLFNNDRTTQHLVQFLLVRFRQSVVTTLANYADCAW